MKAAKHFLTGIGHVQESIVVLDKQLEIELFIIDHASYLIIAIDFRHGRGHRCDTFIVDQQIKRLIGVQLHPISKSIVSVSLHSQRSRARLTE